MFTITEKDIDLWVNTINTIVSENKIKLVKLADNLIEKCKYYLIFLCKIFYNIFKLKGISSY